jgi:glycerate 2-kinase
MEPSDRARADLARIYRAAVAAADPARLTQRALDGAIADAADIPESIRHSAQVYVLAIGKAAPAMLTVLSASLGDRMAAATVVALPASYPMLLADQRIRICESSHPLPSETSQAAAQAALAMLARVRADDLVIVALSGGASAMFAMPPAGVPLADKIALTQSLLRAGASIREMNTVRKHLSAVKGGQIARAANGARVLGLILSDVPGNDLGTIGSGLTAPDPTTYADAIGVLKRRGLWGRAPESIRSHLERGNAGEIAETPKSGDPIFARVCNVIIGDNQTALDGAEAAARGFGYNVDRWRELSGEANDLGRSLAAHLAALKAERACVIAGGEPVATVRGGGKGGRAQQAALATAIELGRLASGRRIAALFAGTDGIDGPTDAAGAFAFPDTVARTKAAGADAAVALRRNDAYNLFKRIGDLFVPGPTGTNVADLFIGLVNY